MTANTSVCVAKADVTIKATIADTLLVPKISLGLGCLIISLKSFCELDPAIALGAAYPIVDHLDQNRHWGESKHCFEEESFKKKIHMLRSA